MPDHYACATQAGILFTFARQLAEKLRAEDALSRTPADQAAEARRSTASAQEVQKAAEGEQRTPLRSSPQSSAAGPARVRREAARCALKSIRQWASGVCALFFGMQHLRWKPPKLAGQFARLPLI